jgi:hypothetical protein
VPAKCPFGAAYRGPLASWEAISNKDKRIFKNPAIASQSRGFCFKPNNQFRPWGGSMKGKTMNDNYARVRTRFAPQVRFEVETVPFRAGQTTELEQLKERLLRQYLQNNPSPDQNAPLRRAANDAAALAWLTPVPLLLFPALFEEKARAALVQRGRQARVRQRSLNLLLEAA